MRVSLLIGFLAVVILGVSSADSGVGSGLLQRLSYLEKEQKELIDADILQRLTALEDKREELVSALSKSILISQVACSKLPGQWKDSPIGAGQFLLGKGKGYKAMDKGGKSTVVLQKKHIPRHTHLLPVDDVPTGKSQQSLRNTDNKDEGIHPTKSRTHTGAGQGLLSKTTAHENMPPYVVVNFCQLVGQT